MSAINRALFLFTCLSICAARQTAAQSLCFPPGFTESDPSAELPASVLGGDELQLETGSFEVLPGNILELSDRVAVRYGSGSLTMDRARFDRDTEILEIIGRGSYIDPEVRVFGEDAVIDLGAESAFFGAAGFDLPNRPATGSAESIQLDGGAHLSLSNAMFTTCPPEQRTWELLAREIDIDVDAGFGTARGVRLQFKGVPILYTPYFSFPIDDRRKRGFLTPQMSESDRTGLDLALPYYFNLAPNYDLLFEPRYLSKRGVQINQQFRYLTPRSNGEVHLDHLDDDRLFGGNRSYFDFEHRTAFGQAWQLLASLREVSDEIYFEDLGKGLGETSQTHLNRFIDMSLFTSNWSLLARLQNYQTIDLAIAAADRPYERRPQILFEGDWSRQRLNFDSETELVYFDRDVGTTGWRFDSTNEISVRLAKPGMYLTPAVALRQTDYWLDNPAPGQERRLSRSLPIGSLDAGLRFERLGRRSARWIQTLEPRLLFVSVPFEDQSLLPVFDTILPDFNLVQLFRKYQYVGPDRIADTDQLSFGVTARLIDRASGKESLMATLGQTRYLTDQTVTLPNQAPTDVNASDYVAELSLYLSDKWNVDVGYQWNGETRSTARTETRFQFRPDDDRFFGVGYRYRPGLLEQGDAALVWPIAARWRVIGSYSYSLLDDKPLEQALGFEYEACCWRLSLFGRRYVSSRTGEIDNSISLQLELKGFSNRGRSPDDLLDRGILGYRRFQNSAVQ